MSRTASAGAPVSSDLDPTAIERVARMRRLGATWGVVNETTGLRLNSTGWAILLAEAGYDRDGLRLDGSGPRSSRARTNPARTAYTAEDLVGQATTFFGLELPAWYSAVTHAGGYLKAIARCGTITYGRFEAAMLPAKVSNRYRALPHFLNDIAERYRRPFLPSLVVLEKGGHPSSGYFAYIRKHHPEIAPEPEDELTFWLAELARVRARYGR